MGVRFITVLVLLGWNIISYGQNNKTCEYLMCHLYPAIDSAIKFLKPNQYAKIIVLKVMEIEKYRGEFSITYIYSFFEHWSAKPTHYLEYNGYILLFKTERYDSIFSLCTSFPRFDTQAKKILRKYSNDNITAQTPGYCIYKYKRKKSYIKTSAAYKLENKYMYYSD